MFRLSGGPYYSYISLRFCAPTFFSKSTLLSLLFSPKMFEVTKNCKFFPRSLWFCKRSDQLILSSNDAKVYKIFFTSVLNLYFGFSFGNVVLLFSENFVCLLYLFSVWKHSERPYDPCFSWLKFLLLAYFWLKFLLLAYFFKILSPILSLLFWWRALESLDVGKKCKKTGYYRDENLQLFGNFQLFFKFSKLCRFSLICSDLMQSDLFRSGVFRRGCRGFSIFLSKWFSSLG